MPHDSEVATMEVYRAIMKPIADITDVIGGEKHISISAVRPLIYKLHNCYLKINASEKSFEKAMKTAMCTKLLQYYDHNVQSSEILNIAAFLDPRFKSLNFLEEEDRIATRLKVQERICNLLPVSDSHLESTESDSTKLIELEVNEVSTSVSDVSENAGCDLRPAPPKRRKQSKFTELLSDVISTEALPANNSPEEQAKIELQQYIDDSILSSSQDTPVHPLTWWFENKSRYRNLCKLALHYLCIPATSVPSERAFSINGHIVRAKRACLLPENVQKLVFLAENLD